MWMCNGKSLTLITMMIHIQTIKKFSRDIHISQSSSQSLRHIWSFRSYHPSRRHFQCRIAFCHSEAFTTPKSSPPHGFLHSETLFVSDFSS